MEQLNNFKNLAEYVDDFTSKFSDLKAFTSVGREFTFADVDIASRRLASFFQHGLGLKQGDRIAIQLPNLVQYPIAAYAALRAGLVIVNTNPMYTPREMQHQFNDSDAQALIIFDQIKPALDAVRGEIPVKHVIVTGVMDLIAGLPEVTDADITTDDNGNYRLADILAHHASTEYTPTTAGMGDVAVLQYTGGTTGVSKGAALSHRNVMANFMQTAERAKPTYKDCEEILVCPLPLYHIYAFAMGMFFTCAHGNHTILIPNPRDLDATVAAMKPYKFTVFAGLNTLFVGLCMHEGFRQLDFSTLKITLSGGSALMEATAAMWEKTTGCRISEGYGLSETSPVVTLNDPTDQVIGSVGTPLIDTEVEFWDDNDQPVPDGEPGQLVCRGPQVMMGYWNRPEETAKVMKDGFFKTGDVGLRLPSGHVKIVDRLKDMIIVSGFNVFPNEIEGVLMAHPDILEAAVVGEPDERTGEKVCAYVTAKTTIDPAAIEAYCREQLTNYKVPKKIVQMDELPKSSVGKILRRELRSA
ncbi:MAG TPA: AMP-binding protein [Pseudomonadales bacterium]|nr:AMP-binding protein [Pseudomonadales bacterium]